MSDEDTMRHDLYAQATLQALVDLGGTAPKAEVLKKVEEAVHPNAYEAGKHKSGPVRWVTAVVWTTTDFRAAGWLTKAPRLEGVWSITDAGRAALAEMSPSELRKTARRMYQIEKLRRDAEKGTTADVPNGENVSPDDVDLPAPLVLAHANDSLVSDTSVPKESLDEWIDLLESRKQIVLYGPPGTGKTFVATQLASHVVGSLKAAYTIVQFHPSYAYEDFFEGFRPVLRDGVAAYELKHGPLRQIAAEAEKNPEQPYVLVIDEINRANIAKVFGELYFLLEYREEQITLQYQTTEEFTLPPNVYIIATMNTVDRSIALIDAAIRRRFSFIELHPSEEPVSGVLERMGRSDLAELLGNLNAAIGEDKRDLQVGPSYLMGVGTDDEVGLSRVWKYDILPLLEEQYFDELTRDEIHARFSLEAIQRTSAD